MKQLQIRQLPIRFLDPANLPPPLENLNEFTLNDSLNIVSGANGSGKTRLLEELERYFSGAYGGNKIVRRVAREDYNQFFDKDKNPSPRVSELEKFKKQYGGDAAFKEHVNSNILNSIVDLALIKLEETTEIDVNDKQFLETRENAIKELFFRNSFYRRIVQDILAFTPLVTGIMEKYNKKEYTRLVDFYKKQITELREDSTLRDQISEAVRSLQSALDHYALDILRVLVRQDAERVEMNRILSAYYNYEINTIAEEGEVTFRRRNERNTIKTDELSSGELALLKLLLWRYKYQNPTASSFELDSFEKISPGELTKVGVLLLDEPDSHFDPKMSKVFFKVLREKFHDTMVIMTTHRLDTIALANEGEIFILEKKQNRAPEIKPCSKLLALAKLTRNLQSYTGMHVKVYTESFDDAKFYEGIYANLMKYLDDIRQVKLPEVQMMIRRFEEWKVKFISQEPSEMDERCLYVFRASDKGKVNYLITRKTLKEPIKVEDIEDRDRRNEIQKLCLDGEKDSLKPLSEKWTKKIKAQALPEMSQYNTFYNTYHRLSRLSRRYQMGFYSSSFESGSAGGHSSVIKALERECNRFFMRPGQRDKQLPEQTFFSSPHSHVANLFRAAQVDHPFGIVDSDNDADNEEKANEVTVTSKEDLKKRVVRIERHSIENFIFDPVVICSILSLSHIDKITDTDLKETFTMLHQALPTHKAEEIQIALTASLKTIQKLCLKCPVVFVGDDLKTFQEKITKATSNDPKAHAALKNLTSIPMGVVIYAFKNDQKMKPYAQSLLNTAVGGDSEKYLGYFCETLVHAKDCYKVIKDLALSTVYTYLEKMVYDLDSDDPNTSELEAKPEQRGFLLDDGSIALLRYHEFMIKLRGHNIEYVLEHYLKNIIPGGTLKDYIMDAICDQATLPQAEGLAIPLDLAKTILDLNAKIKSQVIEKADSNKFKNAEIAELEHKGYFVKYIEDRRRQDIEKADSNKFKNAEMAKPERKRHFVQREDRRRQDQKEEVKNRGSGKKK